MNEGPEIERLKSKVGDLRQQLALAERQLCDERAKAAPFKVGDVALIPKGPVIVRAVEPQSYGVVWYRVSGRKKNGDWSGSTRLAFSLAPLVPARAGQDGTPS